MDSSAFVKLVLEEPESGELRAFLRAHPELASSALLRTEAIRAVRRGGPDRAEQARERLRRVNLIPVDLQLLDLASVLDPDSLRTLDAIHLASAITLGPDLDVVVTYDERMAEGARGLGLAVVSPVNPRVRPNAVPAATTPSRRR